LCGHHVCSAPSTQAIFAANPGKVKFVCPQCFNPEPGDTINADVLDETLRELDGPFEKVTKS
jgi:hypothetical protein